MPDEFIRQLTALRDPLTAYCKHLLWASSDLEDALQETMMTGHRKFPGRDVRAPFRAWIFRTATLTCFNMNRRRAREQSLRSLPVREHKGTRELTVEELIRDPDAALEDLRDETLRACRELTEKERSILLLHAVGGLTCSEIVQSLDLPLGTVQGLLTRARTKLRDRLAGRVYG